MQIFQNRVNRIFDKHNWEFWNSTCFVALEDSMVVEDVVEVVGRFAFQIGGDVTEKLADSVKSFTQNVDCISNSFESV